MLPVILAHGYLGFSKLGPFAYFNDVLGMLQNGGIHEVHATDVPPKGSIADRSNELARQIRQFAPTGKVNLIAHSMGGLDARYLIKNLNGATMIDTLVTLGSPFRGTLAADVAVNPLSLARLSPAAIAAAITEYVAETAVGWPFKAAADTHFAISELREAVQAMAAGDYSHLASYFSGLFTLEDAALRELTTVQCMRMFPADCSDLAGVECYSFAGQLAAASVSSPLTVPALVLTAAGQPNDGVVPVSSATLPQHLGTLDCDHFGLIGWTAKDVSGCYRRICQILTA